MSESIVEHDTEVTYVTISDVRKAPQGMSRGKVAGEDGITTDLIKDRAYFVSKKLAKLYVLCLKTLYVPTSWKNINILLIHIKGDTEDEELRTDQPSFSIVQNIHKDNFEEDKSHA